MNDYNYQHLLNIPYKKMIIEVFLFLILCILFIVSIFTYSYSVDQITGIIKDNYLIINLAQENSDTINRAEFIKINKVQYDFEIVIIEEVIINNSMYYTYKLKLKHTFLNNEVKLVNIYYDNERVIKKIINIAL